MNYLPQNNRKDVVNNNMQVINNNIHSIFYLLFYNRVAEL